VGQESDNEASGVCLEWFLAVLKIQEEMTVAILPSWGAAVLRPYEETVRPRIGAFGGLT